MGDSLLQQAQTALKAGDRKEAVQLSQQAIKQNRQDWRPWWILANAVDSTDYKIKSLQKVLMLNPGHTKAEDMLDELLEQDTGYDTSVDEILNDNPPQTAPQAMPGKQVATSSDGDIIFYSAVSIVLVIGLVGLAALMLPMVIEVPDKENVAGPPPGDVVLLQMEYAFTNRLAEASELTCEAEIGTVEEQIGLLYGNDNMVDDLRIDFSQVETEVVSEGWDYVILELSGDITIRSRQARMEQTVDIGEMIGEGSGQTVKARAVIEDNRWKHC